MKTTYLPNLTYWRLFKSSQLVCRQMACPSGSNVNGHRFKFLSLLNIPILSFPIFNNMLCMDSGFTTAGDWDCVAAVERLPALHYSVDFIFLSFGIMGFIVEL